jgi:hypothetical protein
LFLSSAGMLKSMSSGFVTCPNFMLIVIVWLQGIKKVQYKIKALQN